MVTMAKVLESTIGLSEASSTFDQIYPTMKSTLSDSISFCVFCTPTSGFGQIILVNHLDRHAAELAPDVIKRELERVAHVIADGGGRAAERADEADLDGLLLGQSRCRREYEQRGRSQENSASCPCSSR